MRRVPTVFLEGKSDCMDKLLESNSSKNREQHKSLLHVE